MAKVFISYSSQDEELARQIHRTMSSAGLAPFLAGISIEPGAHWTDVIFEELEEAEWVFFLASQESCRSPAVQQELGASLIQKKTILPILVSIAPEELPGWVGRHQAIDLRKGPHELYSVIQRVSKQIKADQIVSGVIIAAIAIALFANWKGK